MTYRLPALNTLRAFEAAARHSSFKMAASELGVTAGAVSQQVRKLEISLGVSLFRRLPHGLLLTTQGEVYLPRITKVFEDLTEATEAIAPQINSKKFTIGISPGAADILPLNWPNQCNGLKAHVREPITTNDVERIWTNEIDCLIRLGGGPYRDLALITIPVSTGPEKSLNELHYVCKPGLADCRQTRAIVDDLKVHAMAES